MLIRRGFDGLPARRRTFSMNIKALFAGAAVLASLACASAAGAPASAADYTLTVLQDVGGQGDSVATGINASSQIVGESDTASGTDAVLWSFSVTRRAWSA
jgi:hypothetical protein